MSDQNNSSDINTLLPQAEVHFHTKDASVTDAIESLRNDWRYKRVSIIHTEGLLEQAINYYAEYEAPSLLIVETDSIDDGFMEHLDNLAGNLDEGTAAIIIGPVNDVYVYRKLVAMGVSDYLVRPVDPHVLSEVIAKTLVDKIGVSNSRLIAVTGTKGGSGVSSLAQAVAFTLSEQQNQKTLIMDAAGGWSYLSVALGQEPASTLTDAARTANANNKEDLERIQVKLNDNLTLLACGGDSLFDDPISAKDFELLLNQLMTHHPYVVLDLSAAPAHIARTAAQRANKILVTATPTLPSLRIARTIQKEISDLRGGDSDENDVKLIINAQGLDKATEVSTADIEAALETKIDLTIPYDPKLFRAAESQGKTINENKASEKLLKSLAELLEDILDSNASGSTSNTNKNQDSLVGGLLNKIKGA